MMSNDEFNKAGHQRSTAIDRIQLQGMSYMMSKLSTFVETSRPAEEEATAGCASHTLLLLLLLLLWPAQLVLVLLPPPVCLMTSWHWASASTCCSSLSVQDYNESSLHVN